MSFGRGAQLEKMYGDVMVVRRWCLSSHLNAEKVAAKKKEAESNREHGEKKMEIDEIAPFFK